MNTFYFDKNNIEYIIKFIKNNTYCDFFLDRNSVGKLENSLLNTNKELDINVHIPSCVFLERVIKDYGTKKLMPDWTKRFSYEKEHFMVGPGYLDVRVNTTQELSNFCIENYFYKIKDIMTSMLPSRFGPYKTIYDCYFEMFKHYYTDDELSKEWEFAQKLSIENKLIISSNYDFLIKQSTLKYFDLFFKNEKWFKNRKKNDYINNLLDTLLLMESCINPTQRISFLVTENFNDFDKDGVKKICCDMNDFNIIIL